MLICGESFVITIGNSLSAEMSVCGANNITVYASLTRLPLPSDSNRSWLTGVERTHSGRLRCYFLFAGFLPPARRLLPMPRKDLNTGGGGGGIPIR